jgi:hypothetical protein
MHRLLLSFALAGLATLAGCDMLGIESAEKTGAAREADGKAIGGACRHAGRAIEDCYTIYKKAERASVFAGWRDMNDYMRENKIEPVPPLLATPTGKPSQVAQVTTARAIPAAAPAEPAEADPAVGAAAKPRGDGKAKEG